MRGQHHQSLPEFAANPLAVIAAAFSTGILLQTFLSSRLVTVVCLAAVSTVAGVTTLRMSKLRFSTYSVIVCAVFLGAALSAIERTTTSPDQLKNLLSEPNEVSSKGFMGVNSSVKLNQPVELTGYLESEPEAAPQRLYLTLRVQRIRTSVERAVSGSVALLVPVSSEALADELHQLDLRYGSRIRVMTILERTDSFRNPGVSSFTEYLDRKGHDATGFVKSPLLIERLDNERVFLPLAWLYQWRRQIQTEIDRLFSRETAGVLNAALLGNRNGLSRETSERFREGGTFHVLVISGLHITFLGAIIFFVTRRFTSSKTLQFLISVSLLWAYSMAVGAEASVVRAALMFTLVIMAPLVLRCASSLNALGAAALALLVWRPSELLDPSVQLTFASVLAIVTLAWPVLQKLSAIGSWRPTGETPYPPSCAPGLRVMCECLFWSDKQAKRELARANYSYTLFKTPWAATLERLHLQPALRYAFGAVVVSGAVQIMLLPMLVVYFHRLSISSFVLNIGVSVMMATMAITAIVGLVIAQVNSTLASIVIELTNILNWVMVHSVDPFVKLRIASLRLPEYAGLTSVIYCFYYIPIIMLASLLHHWNPLSLSGKTNHRFRFIGRAVFIGQVCVIVVIVAHPFSAGSPSGKLDIDFLDVGQGDSALITFPDNTTLLVDGGGRPGPFEASESSDENFEQETRSIGEAVVSEYLWWRGLDHVDYILATHADADHIDGLNDVARNFHVRAALVARTPTADQEYAKFSETLAKERIPIQTIAEGDVLRFAESDIAVLWPPAIANPNSPSRNNDSIVLRLKFRNRTFLLMGDIEAAAENAILRRQEDLEADVVKVPHHGSRTSSTEAFVRAAGSQFAVVSVGQTSIFGHPHQDVVDRWRVSGAKVLTTGKSGTITFSTDGSELNVATFVNSR